MNHIYRALEEKYRGSREEIRSRLRVYLPFIEPLKLIQTPARAVDLGCGRGEWLELLRDAGFDAHGVDLDEGMLAACHESRLRVTKSDALSYLRELPDASHMIVSGFHIAEHLSFADLRLLVEEALRVLEPAGLLILETPNPENIRVGTTTFYLDPTHRHPLPPGLLSFLPEYFGFARVKVIRLQESPELTQSNTATLNDVLGGVSPDYAVIAQKAAGKAHMTATSHAFEVHYGLTLEELVGRFDGRLATHMEKASQVLDAARSEAPSQSAALAQAANAWEKVSTALIDELALKNEAIAVRDVEIAAKNRAIAAKASEVAHLNEVLAARVAQLNEVLAANSSENARLRQRFAEIERSTSWRLTAPLRRAKRATRWFLTGMWSWIALKPGSRPHRVARGVIRRHPRLAAVARRVVEPFPSFRARLQTGPVRGPDPIDHLDLGAEPEGVRQAYLRLVQAREKMTKGI